MNTHQKVLILNAGYEPLLAVSWQRAMCLIFRDKVEVVESYKDITIKSATKTFNVPAVIRLETYSRPAPSSAKFCRENIYLRDNHQCQYCGKSKASRELTFDHVLPKSKGGQTNWKNIVTACSGCNRKKADRTPSEAKMSLLNEPGLPNVKKMRRALFAQGREIPIEWDNWI